MPKYSGEGNAYPGYGYMQNYPDGQPIDNRTYQPYEGREPYETGDYPQPSLEDGEIYVTQGKNIYLLRFTPDSDHMSGEVIPVGSFKFTVDPACESVSWFGDTPANVRFDAKLQKQILEFRGVDK